LKPNQCPNDPSGNDPPWVPLDPDLPPGDPRDMTPFLPGLTNPRPWEPIRFPVRFPSWAVP
jgi:hypothetical protein